MPVLGPGTQTFTIADLANEVIIKVENRTTDLPRAYRWLAESLLELGNNQDLRDEFCELEDVGPTVNLTIGTQEYPEATFVQPGAFNKSTLSFLLWLDPPTNTKRRKLRMFNYQEADQYLETPQAQGPPTYWYRYHTNFGFYLVPDLQYQVQARYLKVYPVNWAALQFTPILMQYDWFDVIILAATERGWIELEEFDKAQKIHTLLYGDAHLGDPNSKQPVNIGLIKSRKLQRELEAWREEMPLRPYVPRYSH